ncbi:MAG: DNA repair protein RecN [Gammaproteobacteria bacterium]|nr:DNA repair protein RecN [Gammaproteobacteria bacterium]
MLTHLQLRDFVIVDEAELEFASGLTALTGETGAGKSLLVDALSMIAGGRASGDVVRQGAQRAEVAASFSPLPPAALAWLEEQSIEHDGEVLVRRVVGADGRSRNYLNGQAVPLQSLRELLESLVEIHGQQEFQRLVTREAQRALLDEHGAARDLAQRVAAAYQQHRDSARELAGRRAAAADLDGRRDLLRHQLGELQASVTSAAEITALFIERKRVADRGRLVDGARTALALSYESDGDNAHDLLGKARAALRNLGDADPGLRPITALLDEAAINVREAGDALRRYLESLDMDPARQDEIERRAAALESLARKHHLRAEELPERAAEIERELAALDNARVDIAELERRVAALDSAYGDAAARLSAARKAAAATLGGQVTGLMQSLGMPGGRFEVDVATTPGQIAEHGADTVEFLVSANAGQMPKSLARVASGGELSRISLAIQVAAAARNGAGCMVFDEVDAGVGGATAEIVGRELRALGERCQVRCVTHLAQVASQAQSQMRVTKHRDGDATRTRIEPLNGTDRVEEIARMLGGIAVSDQARAHAREMLARGAPAGAAKVKRSRGG